MLAVHGAGPPHDGLVTGPGQGDVEQPKVLAPSLLELELLVFVELVALVGHVDGPPILPARVVEDGHLRRAAAAVPGGRAVDDRELQAFAAVDGDDLDRFGVGLESPRPFLVLGVTCRIVDATSQPRGHRRRSQAFGHTRLVEELGNVPEVGHEAFARAALEHSSRNIAGAADRLEQRGNALVAEEGRPLMEGPVQILPGFL